MGDRHEDRNAIWTSSTLCGGRCHTTVSLVDSKGWIWVEAWSTGQVEMLEIEQWCSKGETREATVICDRSWVSNDAGEAWHDFQLEKRIDVLGMFRPYELNSPEECNFCSLFVVVDDT